MTFKDLDAQVQKFEKEAEKDMEALTSSDQNLTQSISKKSISTPAPVRKKPKIFVGSANKTQILEVNVNQKGSQLSPDFKQQQEPISA